MIEKRNDFAKLLEETVIPSSLSIKEQEDSYKQLQIAAEKILPQSLFRYRSCSERSISAFDKDELWVSTANCMNDGFDTRAYVDPKHKQECMDQILSVFDIQKKDFMNWIHLPDGLPPHFSQVQNIVHSLSNEAFLSILEELKKVC